MPIKRQNSAIRCEITPFFYLILLTFHLTRRGPFRSEAPSTVQAITDSHYLLVGRTDAVRGWCGPWRGGGRPTILPLPKKRADWDAAINLKVTYTRNPLCGRPPPPSQCVVGGGGVQTGLTPNANSCHFRSCFFTYTHFIFKTHLL